MKKLLIYGTNPQAQSLLKMITVENQAEVSAFIIDDDYFKNDELCGLPIIKTSKVKDTFSPDDYEISLSFGYKNMVYNREEKFNFCKQMGYSIYTFISKNAIVYTSDIGEGCNIYPATVIAPNVSIGKGSFIEMGCIIAHNTRIGDFNFIAPGVHFCGGITSEEHCFFGSACKIINGLHIGKNVFVSAGAKVSCGLNDNASVQASKSIIRENCSFEIMKKMFK